MTNIIKQNGEYYNAELKELKDRESVDVTLELNSPYEHKGKWGPFYVFKGTINRQSNVSFIVSAKMRGKEYGKFLVDMLKQYTIGDTIKITRVNAKTKAGVEFTMWDVTPLNVTQQPPAAENPLKAQLVDMLVSTSQGKEFATPLEKLAYANEQLKNAGVDDEPLRNEIALAFSNK
jgi:hypothetical protein